MTNGPAAHGGGTHSSSGGTTEAGGVTITVKGGTITGDIYARGQSATDTVGSASVTFKGAASPRTPYVCHGVAMILRGAGAPAYDIAPGMFFAKKRLETPNRACTQVFYSL